MSLAQQHDLFCKNSMSLFVAGLLFQTSELLPTDLTGSVCDSGLVSQPPPLAGETEFVGLD